jgi:hypothetical protein
LPVGANPEAVSPQDETERFGYVLPPKPELRFTPEQWVERESLRAGLEEEVKINALLPLVVMWYESAGNPLAVSKKGGIGLMQIMPANAQFYGFEEGELCDELSTKAREAIAALTDEKRAEAGDSEIERATIAGTLSAVVRLLGETGRLVPGVLTRRLANIAVHSSSLQTVEAKREAERKRIVLPGR